MEVKIKVYGPRGEERTIDLCDTEEQLKRITVLQLKKKIKTVFGISGSDVQLLHGGRYLEEGALVSDYPIKHMSTIFTHAGGYPLRRTGGIGDSAAVGRGRYQPRQMERAAAATNTTEKSHLTHVTFYVKTLKGAILTITFTEKQFKSATVLQMKTKIRESEGIPEDQQRLIFTGQQLEDQKLLSDYRFVHGTTIHLVLKLRGGGDMGRWRGWMRWMERRTRGRRDGGMGDKEGKTRSMEVLMNL